MIRKDLIDRVAIKNDCLDRKVVEEIVIAIFDEIVVALLNNERVVINKFGRFESRFKKARPGRNPRTGESKEISARYSVTFHAAPTLRQFVNSEKRKDVKMLPQKGSRGPYRKTRRNQD